MKTIHHLRLACVCALAIVGLAREATAATITWGSVTTISGASDVLTNGTRVDAVTFWTSDLTINGVTFDHYSSYTTPSANGFNKADLHFANSSAITIGADLGPLQTYGPQVTDYDKLLAKSSYFPYSGASPTGSVMFAGLTLGHTYQVQVWSPIWSGGPYTIEYDGLTFTLNNNTAQYAIGQFTADATTQLFFWGKNPTYAALPGAVQLRDVTVIPEPSTFALVGLALLPILLRRRSKQ